MNSFSLQSKIALGTVQLGLSYGINNQTGKPNKKVAFEILNYAHKHQIQMLDTAEAYGDSLNVIGQYISESKNNPFKVISKFISDGKPLVERVEQQLAAVASPQLYGYLYHRFSDYESGSHKNELLELKDKKKIARIGVSVYSMNELNTVVHDPDIEIIQLPFNPFDASLEKKELLLRAKKNNKEVHVRSVFLQGLFFKNPEKLTGNLQGFKSSLKEFLSIISENNLTTTQACLNYALHQSFVDHVVIGVETPEQLAQNLSSILANYPHHVKQSLELIEVPDKRLLNPAYWKP